MNNWRLLEAEIIDVLRRRHCPMVDHFGNIWSQGDIDLTFLARELSDRVEVRSKAVQEKS